MHVSSASLKGALAARTRHQMPETAFLVPLVPRSFLWCSRFGLEIKAPSSIYCYAVKSAGLARLEALELRQQAMTEIRIVLMVKTILVCKLASFAASTRDSTETQTKTGRCEIEDLPGCQKPKETPWKTQHNYRDRHKLWQDDPHA
eukprot:3591382-Rhodomonas_salina.1